MSPELNEEKPIDSLSPSEMYDLYAPAVYGRIVSIVQKEPIAEKILERVFVDSFNDKATFSNTFLTPLTTLLNHSRKKSNKTIKALRILNECCAGTTISMKDKE